MAGRLLALDGLRGLLALYILAGHTLPFLDLPPRVASLGTCASHGRGAVDLFFILSGLVILGSLDQISATPRPAMRFLLARAGRLLPVYGLALALAAGALSLGDPFSAMTWLPASGAAHEILEAGWPMPWFWHLTAHALLLQGLLPPALLSDAEFSILGPAWSLSTEWQFYALAALALAVRGGAVTSAAQLRHWLGGLMLLALLGLGNGLLPPEWRFGRAFLPQEAWYFALGIASFALLRRPQDREARLLFAMTLAAACAFSWFATQADAVLVPLVWALCLSCQARELAPRFAQAALRQGYRLLTSPCLLWAGRISYSLYLTHAPVQRLLMLWLAPGAGGDWSRFTLAWAGPAIALPLLVALLVHHMVEEPLRRRRHGRPGDKGASRVSPPLCASGSNTSAGGRP